MDQNDVLEVLRKNKGWMIVGEVMVILGVGRCAVNNALRHLFRDGDVFRKEVPIRIGGKSYLWKYKD